MDRGKGALGWMAAGVCLLLLLPGLVREGMFMDGMLYTVVAHNEARGIGTFWQPRFSQMGLAGLESFHEHPPLAFGLQSLWFRALGSGFWVERAYALAAAIGMAMLLVLLWRELARQDPRRERLAAWPVLLWGIVPQVFWCYHNNMLENTMGLFTTAALWAFLRGLRTGSAALALAAGGLVFLASFTKGVPGLYPLAVPALWWAITRRTGVGQAALHTLLATAAVAGTYALLWQWPDARANLSTYVDVRLLHRIAAMPTVEHRGQILLDLVSSQLGPLLIAGLVAWRGAGHGARKDRSTAVALLAIGLAGVAPMMLTLVQKSFYSVPAFPPIALGLAWWSAPAVAHLLERAEQRQVWLKGMQRAGMLLVAIALTAAALLWGRPARDADMLRDVAIIGERVPAGSLVGADPVLWEQWNLQGYLLRYHDISLDISGRSSPWHLAPRGASPPAACAASGAGLRTLELTACSGPTGAME